jgi:hypothetical protein
MLFVVRGRSVLGATIFVSLDVLAGVAEVLQADRVLVGLNGLKARRP